MPVTTPRRPRRPARAAPPRPLSKKWQRLMQHIPGYDPITTAPPGSWFDPKAAQDVIDFFAECLKHVEGPLGGQPFVLEPWEQALLGCLYGWKRPDGLRRYREVWLYIPKKNGKTFLLSGLVLYTLVRDPEPGIKAFSAASDSNQAGLVYEQMRGMILQEPMLKARLKIYTAKKVIEYLARFAFYRVLSAKPDTKHGLNIHFAAIDETHAHLNRELIDVLTGGVGSRTQPIIVHATTADYDRPSICNEKLVYAKKVRDGALHDPAFLPVIYEGDEALWEEEDEWYRVNPNLGVSKSLDHMRREYQRAKETPGYENIFKRLELNILTRLDSKWLNLARWDASAGTVNPEALRGQPCYAGLDLGSTSDLTSLCLLFPQPDGAYKALWWHWCPRDTAHRRNNRDHVDYEGWATQGLLELTPGNETDYRHIRARIKAIADHYPIQEIAVDRLFQGAQLCQDLKDDFGETHDGQDRVVPFGMGFYSMAAPTAELERLINRGELHHGGNALVRWMAGNCVVKMDEAGNLKPDKAKSADKIDGVVACLMALGRAMVAEAPAGPSVYETRGVIVL